MVLGLDRGQGEAAVAADDGGHPVQVGRRGGGIPKELGVVVGVGVDDSRSHHQTGGIELGGGLFGDLADGHDLSVTDADVGAATRSSGAVHYQTVANGVIEHGEVPLY